MVYLGNMKKNGVRITHIDNTSPAYSAGLRKDDVILIINGEPIEDDIDGSFFSACEKLEVTVRKKDKIKTYYVIRTPGEFLGIEFASPPVRRCGNRCVFCFIDQLPKGLRKSLYVKDEDYRHSFLNGNYITLTTITPEQIEKIIRYGLSPLYISVHVTDSDIRCRMLNNRRAGNIMDLLEKLAGAGICFHTQVVVCPGINDGKVLKQTIADLLSFNTGVLSIAVVPVGLTKHRRKYLKPVSQEIAFSICRMVDALSEKDKMKIGRRRVFIADEFHVLASLPIPGHDYYEDFPQIENGVGLIRILLNEWDRVKKKLYKRKINKTRITQRENRYLILTSVHAYPYLQKIVEKLDACFDCYTIRLQSVTNRFFGESVTVAGLITARDIIYTVRNFNQPCDAVMVPSVIFNYRGYTLDGYSIDRIKKHLRKQVVSIENISELVNLFKE